MAKVLFAGNWAPGNELPQEEPGASLTAEEKKILETVLREVGSQPLGGVPGEFIVQAVTSVFLAGGLVMIEYAGLDAFGDPAVYSTWRSFRSFGYPGFSCLVVTNERRVILEEVHRVAARMWIWQLPGSYFRREAEHHAQLREFLELNHGVRFGGQTQIIPVGRFQPLPDIQEHVIQAFVVHGIDWNAPPEKSWDDSKAGRRRPIRSVRSFSLEEIDQMTASGAIPLGVTEAILRRAERLPVAPLF